MTAKAYFYYITVFLTKYNKLWHSYNVSLAYCFHMNAV